MASNRTSGNLLGLQINNEFIACEMSCDFNFETEMLSASPIYTGRWEDSIPGVRSWNISLNAGLLMRMVGAGLPNVINAFMTGEKMAIAFRTKLNDYLPNLVITGNVLVQSGNISSSVNTLASWNVTLKGCGAFNVGINTNIVYALATGMPMEALQDGVNHMIGGDSGGVVSSNNMIGEPGTETGGNTGNTNTTPTQIANVGDGGGTLQFGKFDSDTFTTTGKPDNLVSIVYED